MLQHARLLVLTVYLAFLAIPTTVYGEDGCSASSGDYEFIPLIGIPGFNPCAGIDWFINFLFGWAIGIAALLAVIKIAIAGIQYMFTDLVTSKETAKSEIRAALLGLLIILASIVILTTINPALNDFDILDAENNAPYTKAPPAVVIGGDSPYKLLSGDKVISCKGVDKSTCQTTICTPVGGTVYDQGIEKLDGTVSGVGKPWCVVPPETPPTEPPDGFITIADGIYYDPEVTYTVAKIQEFVKATQATGIYYEHWNFLSSGDESMEVATCKAKYGDGAKAFIFKAPPGSGKYLLCTK